MLLYIDELPFSPDPYSLIFWPWKICLLQYFQHLWQLDFNCFQGILFETEYGCKKTPAPYTWPKQFSSVLRSPRKHPFFATWEENGFSVQTLLCVGVNVASVASLNISHSPGLSLSPYRVMLTEPEFYMGSVDLSTKQDGKYLCSYSWEEVNFSWLDPLSWMQ